MKNHKLPSRFLALALCLCMVLSLMPMMPLVAEAATVPTYIASIGVSQDGSSGSTGVNDCKRELAGHTIIDVDLNDEAGGDYVYMGYKTTMDPAQAITGIVFRVGENPPDSISYGGSTFYLVGGSTEANTAKLGGYIDLNAKAGGAYIYTYVTRDPNYGAPLTNLTVNRVSTHYGWSAATDTDGNEMDLNYDASNYYLYLHYQRFSATVTNTFYYLDARGSRFTSTQSGAVKNHLEAMTKAPSVPSTVTYDGRSFRFVGWREDDAAAAPTTTSPSATYMTGNKLYRAVYEGTLTLSYDANGGFGAPASQTATQYINTGTSYIVRQSHTFTISPYKPIYFQMCMFDQWDGVGNNTTITIDFNKTLSAKWLEHTGLEDDSICDRCGESLDEPTLSNGIYYISNRAQLIWFMQYVNSFGVGASAVLTADIDMSGYNWTPIASTGLYYGTTSYSNAGYTGTFDGQGHVISNLTVTGSSSTDGSYGLFGTVSGTVKNVGINNFRFTGGGKDTRVGAVVGQMLDGSRVENCYATNININTKVNTNSGVAGGIAGCNYAGTVSGCYTDNVDITAARYGGIVGDNCGDISDTDRLGTMENCYTSHIYLRDPSKLGNALSGEAGVSAEWFASGEITWLLNGSSANGMWKQTVGSGLPGFSGGTVYQVLRCDGKTITYSNSSTSPQAHTFVNNICTFCGAYVDGAVASVSKNGSVIAVYTTLNDAIQAVADCTAADETVITLMQYIDLGDSYQRISSGVFTIDLNGFEISSTRSNYGALYIDGATTNVTIQGTGENSKITGGYAGIEIHEAVLTITGGSISSIFGVFANYGSTVTISGGTISSETYGVYAFYSTVTISSGNIFGGIYDIYNYHSSSNISLTLGGNGIGTTFPGGIEVGGTTLNAILGEGAAYWQGNTMIIPADGATEITGGDVVIKAECKHPGDKTYTNNGDDHSYTYSCCNYTVTEGHSYTNGLCVCGAMISDAVASVSKNGIVTGAYTTLNDAIQAVRNCTAADKAVVTILQDIALGYSYQEISSGVFTVDLNSKTLSGTNSTYGVLYLNGLSVNVTVTDSGTGGTISGYYGVIATYNGRVTISGGTISGEQSGVAAQYLGTVTITGGTISGEKHGVAAYFGGRVTIIGGTISGEKHGVYADGSNVIIRGGSISGDTYDIINSFATMILTLGENGVGATFPGGITVDGTTLNEILDEGAAYWQGNTMILPANNATEIPGGDVVIKAECKHPGDKTYTNNGDDHSYTCSSCNATVTEGHTYTNDLCACGAAHPDMVASVSKNGIVTGAYTTLNDAIQAVKDCTADDKAVVTILKDIALGDSYQKISSGVFTIDLNGFEISSTSSDYGVLHISGSTTNVTIQGTGENSKITGSYAGIQLNNGATLTVISGTISGSTYGVNASRSTVTITGGTISGDYSVYVTGGSTVTITGGTISGVYEGVHAYNNSTVTISGGTISGEESGVTTLRSTLTISGGTISGENTGVDHATGTATISGGTISGGAYGIAADRSTVTISGGTISDGNIRPSFTGVYILDSTVTISGGSISSDDSDDLDIYTHNYSSNSIIALTLGEDGVGATFPGGILIEGTTLNAILGEGAAYWQGDKQINPADDDIEITGGDVVIKAACKHSGDKTYTNNGDDHTYTCSVCDATVTEGHTYIDGVCVCGVADVNVAVASTTVGGITTYYGTLGSAIQAVKDCTAADKAVVTILKDIALGDSYQSIYSGVFTIDLNGHEISSTNDRWGALYLSGTDVNVTVQGAGESSKITGSSDGITVFDKATLTITGGTISGDDDCGVYAVGSTVTINGGTISGDDCGVKTGYCTLIISDGTISGYFGVSPFETDLIISGGTISGDALSVYSEYSTVTISGGSISTGDRHIYSYHSTTTLTLGENGVGARFLGGITVMYATLNEILGEGAAYWQGDKQIIPADNANAIFNGDVVIKAYVAPVYSGWTEIDGNWYYYDPDTGKPVTGITRVPYPAEVINGVTYAPNMEDVKYANDKGTLFKDSISAFFVFDENGVFQSNMNGMTSDNRWAVNGCIVWHVGLVQVGEDYYYFLGDSDLGGNKMATGDVYVSRNTTDFDMVVGGVYTFGEDGKLCMYEGITEVNGVLRYYENARLMLGKGLTKVGENYIYVNSTGELIVDADYYVPGNDLGIASGTYYFDESGFMTQPVSTDKDGVYFENGAWYYYVDGKIAYNQGLISVNTTWYGDDGSENVYSGYIYVRSSGKLATGSYYITNVENDNSGLFITGQKVVFSDIGIADMPKHGIVDVDGTLYFYQYNAIQYNAGLIEHNGGWIYVRSNGQLAVGPYWITNTNGNLDAGMYEFGTDGYLVITDVEDGIVEENGVLYYYLDGKKQYGLGLKRLEDGSYIYVRSNGELATGSYWITNHNGLLPEGLYTFGEDGILTAN